MQQSIFNLPIFGNEEVVSNEPPTLISLIKKRRNLKKNKGVTVVDMDGAVISDQNVNAGLDNEIGTIDSQLTSLGINPDEADIKVGDLPDTISDQNIQDLLKEQNKYSFNQKKSALLWKQALRDKILAQPDSPEKQSQVESWSYLNDNIEFTPGFSGKSNLDYNNFYNGINSAKSLIVANLQGDERNQALANLRKSTEDGFAKLLLKDPNAQQRWKDLGLNPFQGVALDVMKIDGDGDVYENQIKIKTTDPKAQAEQRYKLAELENLGMNIVGGSLNRILEDRSNKSKEANEFYNQNKERLNQLATIIKQDKNLSPSAKSTLAGFQDEYDNVMQGKDPSGKFFITMDLEGLESKIKSGDASRVDVITYNKRIDQLNTIASKYKSALNQYMDDSGASDETIAEYNKLINDIESKKPDQVGTDAAVAWVEYMNNLKQSQKDRFPEYTKFEIERLVKDVAGEKRGLVERNLWKSVTPFADIVRGSKDIVNEFFLSPEELEQSRMSGAFDRRILDMEVGYDTPEERAEDDRPFIPVFSKPVEDNIANIKSSDMSEDEKQSRIRFIVEQEAKNGKVKYIANPRFGKLNLTGTAMVARTLDFASQFAPQMTISYLSGGFGNVSKLRRLMTLAGSTAASSFAREYDGAVQRGESNPFQRAAVKTLSEAASETIFDDIKFLKKISSSKVLGDITDEQWNNIRKSFGSKVLDAAKVGGGAFLKEAAVEEPLSQVMDNVSSNLIFNEDVGAFDNVEKVLLESMMGMAPLSALGMAGRYRKTNLGQKHIMYQIGYKADDVIQAVNDRLASGEITADEARQRIAAANTMKSVIANMPMYDKSGKPLDDDQKARYAWNEYSKTIASAPEALPTEQKNELKDIVEQADQENSKILNGEDILIDKDATTESQVQEGLTESNISQPQGAVQGQPEVGQGEGQQGQAEIPPADVSDSDIGSKREVIKQKFDFITDQDFVAESFTPEEDAADRAALPESDFKSEQELEAFLADGEYAMLTGMNPDAVALSKIANKKLNDRATQWLADRGLKATPIFGKYDNSERSFLVPNMTKAQAIEFAKEFQQDSVAHSSGLVYKDGSFNPRTEGVNLEPRFDQGGDFFSSINIGGKPVDFSVNYDFETTVPAEGMQVDEQGQLIDTKLQDAVVKASQALDKSGIKFNIIDTSVNPEQADAARGNQAIFRDTDGTITIDKSKLANDIEAGIVVWHESSHPVMNIIRNTDRRLYDALVRGLTDAAKKNTGIQKALDWATDGYEGNDVQADEALVETIARIAEGVVDVSTLNTGLRQRIIDFINDIAKIFGIDPILNNTDLAEFKRVATQVADALSQGRDIAEIVGEENVLEYGAPIGVPVQPKIADKYGPKVSHNGGNYKLSFVRPSDIIDIKSLIKEIADKDQKVWFWVADQLGRGMYYDSVIDGEHYLDAGPSFALDPKNRDKKVIWATGKGENWVKDKIAKSDYIFIISGSPKNSKLFNKRVAEITFNRIKKVVGEEGSWDKFKSEVLGVSKIGKINEILNKYNSFEELLATPDRKELLIQFDEQKAKKGTPLKALLEKYGAFVDYNDLRDGFFKDNDFNMNDVMLVLKPTEYGGKSDHSTYENNILGEVVGVPDRRVDAFELMPDDFKAKYAPDMSKTGRSQAVAPYGSGIKNIQASVGGRNIEDISSVRKVSKGVFDSIKDVVTKLGYGYLPDDVQKKMKKKEMLINEDLHDMEVLATRLSDEVKKAYGKRYNNLDQDIKDKLDSALRNFNNLTEEERDAARAEIPESVLSIIESMRTYIDVMSKRLTDAGLLDSTLEPAFDDEKGLGVYLTRTYRKYDDPKWATKIPDEVKQRAFEFLKANNKIKEYDSQGNETGEREMTDEEVEGLIDYIATNTDPVMDGLNAANTGKVKADILKGRKVIPKEIRDLMGEYKDPMVNFAKTIAKISSLYHTYNTLKAIGEENTGKIFFKRPTGEYYVPVAGEGTSKVQPLVGLYTTPEIADAFRKATDNATSNDANQLVLRLLASVNGIVKIGKTAGSVSSWIRNIIGGYGLMVKDGHILGTGMADGWKTAFKYFTNKSTDNPEAQAKFKEYVRMGIIGDGVGVGEFFAIVKAAQKYENPIDWLTKDSKLGRFVKGVKGLYSVQDDIFRVWAYENEKARLEARKTDMSEQEVKDEAARKARATYPTYSETPEIVRQLAKFVPISSFPAFTAELIRTYKNSLKIAIEEIKDPEMRDVGINRLSGTMMYTFMGYLLTSISASLMGVTDEEEEDIRRYLPEWSKNSQLLYIGRGDNGLPIYIDMGFSLPASYFAKPTVAMGREDRDFADKAKDALGEIASPFISPEILLAQIAKGYKKTRRSDDLDEILGKYAGPIYEALEPGTIASLRRIYKGVAGDVDSYGQRYDSKLETIAFTTGQRIKSMEIPVGFLFKVRDFMDYKSDVTGAYYTAKRNVRADKSQVRDKLEEANEKLKGQFEEFRKDYKSGLRLLSKGTTVKRAKNAMRQIMEDKNVPKDFIKALEQNKLMPPLKDKEDKK